MRMLRSQEDGACFGYFHQFGAYTEELTLGKSPKTKAMPCRCAALVHLGAGGRGKVIQGHSGGTPHGGRPKRCIPAPRSRHGQSDGLRCRSLTDRRIPGLGCRSSSRPRYRSSQAGQQTRGRTSAAPDRATGLGASPSSRRQPNPCGFPCDRPHASATRRLATRHLSTVASHFRRIQPTRSGCGTGWLNR